MDKTIKLEETIQNLIGKMNIQKYDHTEISPYTVPEEVPAQIEEQKKVLTELLKLNRNEAFPSILEQGLYAKPGFRKYVNEIITGWKIDHKYLISLITDQNSSKNIVKGCSYIIAILNEDIFEKWVNELKEGLSATKEESRKVEREVLVSGSECLCKNDPDYHNNVFLCGGTNTREAYCCSSTAIYETKDETLYEDVPDIEKRLDTVEKLGIFYRAPGKNKIVGDLLRKIYFENEHYSIRREAGLSLGYSILRVKANLYPVTFLAGAAILACASKPLIIKAVKALTSYLN